jgi:uncharacterized membrane protein YfcA
MIAAALSMLKGRSQSPREDQEWRLPLLFFEGLLIGFLTGLVGAGGGFMIIPALVWLTGLPFKTAVGTSLFIIAVNSLLGFMGDVLNYHMDWNFLLLLSSLAIVGIFIGNKLHKEIEGDRLRIIFAWFVLVVGTSIMIREVIYSFN